MNAPPETLPWQSIVSFLEKNPFQEKTLTPYKPRNTAVEPDTTPLNEWHIQPVEPAGPLSCILYLQSIDYSNMSVAARSAMIRDTCTSLQTNAETHLRGRAWPVRKTAEGIVAAAFQPLPKDWSKLGLAAIAELSECQLIFFSLEKKELSFIPEDTRLWKSERPCYMIQHDARAVWQPPVGFTNKSLCKWLEEKEREGWSVAWPSADGTLVELKTLAEQVSIQVPPKCLKETLAKQVGRSQSIKRFAQWEFA